MAWIIYIKWLILPIGTTHNGRWDGWYGPSGREGSYDFAKIRESLVSKALHNIGIPLANNKRINSLRRKTEIKCAYGINGTEPEKPCEIKNSVCLFNIRLDPCEVRYFIS